MSISPRNAPTTADTAITIRVSLIISWREGHVTLRSSEATSPIALKLNALRAASGLIRRGTPAFRAILIT